jgi:hypothetical protein
VVRDSGRPVCITSAPVISDPQLAEGVLRLGLRYEPGQAAWTAVMPVAEPTRVVVDGADLPKGQAGIEGAEGWSYRASVGCLTLKLRYDRKAPRAVQIVGAKAIAPTLPSPGWEFDGGSTEGWAGAHDVAPLGAKDGRLIIEVTGGDPYLYGPAFEADAAEYPGIVFRARATAPNGQLFFATDSGGFGEARSRAFTLPADGAFHEVRMDLRDHPEWKGTITQFRLDFAGPPCHVEIDWVRMLKAGG